jgi:beta-glucosidase
VTDVNLDPEDVALVRTVAEKKVPIVVLLLTGRPLVLEPILDLAEAIVVAWLPGTEADGIADVLFGDVPPTGKLSHSWPRSSEQLPLNVGDADYDPVFEYGFGLNW